MKHIFTLLFILGSVHVVTAQKSKTAPVITRYYQFTGAIDKYPVTLNIHRKDDDFYASYYYNSTEEAIDLFGILQKDGSLRLTNNNQETGDMTEEFTGKFKDSSFSGTWIHNGKVLPFRVSKPQNTDGLNFDYVITSGSKPLPKEQQFSRSQLTYEGAAVCPTPSSTHPATKLIKEKIFAAFGSEPTGSIGEAMLGEKKNALTLPKDDNEIESYGVMTHVTIEYWNKQLLSLSFFSWSDGGGAHGNYTVKHTNIDLVNNKVIGLDDVLGDCNKLPALLEKKFRAVYNVKNGEKTSSYLLVDTIPVTDNFSITTKGITFSYDPYEIGAYAMGQIKLYIPFKEMEGCVTEEFKKLIGKGNK